MTFLDWCLHASGARKANLLRRWEQNLLRRLLRAVEEEPFDHLTSDGREAESNSPFDCLAAEVPAEANDVKPCRAENEACRLPHGDCERIGRPPGVLIADDEEAICFGLSRELQRQGIATYVAADGLTALQLFQEHEHTIDAVFLDVCMPRLDGMGTLTAMRRIDPAIRCCFMTAFSVASLCNRNEAPPAEILKKPFDLDAFLGVATRLLAG